jgi:hypothetical protein
MPLESTQVRILDGHSKIVDGITDDNRHIDSDFLRIGKGVFENLMPKITVAVNRGNIEIWQLHGSPKMDRSCSSELTHPENGLRSRLSKDGDNGSPCELYRSGRAIFVDAGSDLIRG